MSCWPTYDVIAQPLDSVSAQPGTVVEVESTGLSDAAPATEEQLALRRTNRLVTALLITVALVLVLLLVFRYREMRIHKRIAAHQQELEQLNEVKDRIFAILGHDLRKPAIAFLSVGKNLRYLLDKGDAAALRKFGTDIEHSAIALYTLIENLLRWAQVQRSAVSYRPESVAAHRLIEAARYLVTPRADAKSITITNDIPESLMVHADLVAMQVVLLNLLDNAIKYSNPGDTITCHAEPSEENTVCIFICDTGAGMTPEQLDTLFELYTSKSTAGTNGEQGAGLGLHLVEELVTMQQGTVVVDSTLGEGTEVCVILSVG